MGERTYFCHSKVCDLDLLTGGEEEITWFDILVHDPLAVNVLQPIDKLDKVPMYSITSHNYISQLSGDAPEIYDELKYTYMQHTCIIHASYMLYTTHFHSTYLCACQTGNLLWGALSNISCKPPTQYSSTTYVRTKVKEKNSTETVWRTIIIVHNILAT